MVTSMRGHNAMKSIAKYGILLTVVLISLLLYFYNGLLIKPLKILIFSKPNINNKILCKDLYEIYKEIDDKNNNIKSKVYRLFKKMSCLTDSLKVVTPFTSKVTKKQIVDVCPEVYQGMKYGYPAYLTGFEFTNCSNARPLPSIVTIVLNSINQKIDLLVIISKIERLYPKVKIIIGTTKNIIYNKKSDIHIIKYSPQKSLSDIWNDLLLQVKTPYVFIAENIEDITLDSRFNRLIGMLSNFEDVGIVGGAVRDFEGNWIYNCYQVKMSNYILTYEEGYYHSKNECMVCDHIEGPFMAKTALLQKIKLDNKVRSNIFSDLFIRLRKKYISILSCVDVMSFIHYHMDVTLINWLPIAQKWILNRIVLPDQVIHMFTCEDINTNCDTISITQQHLLPICCTDLIANVLTQITKICEQLNITFMIDNGSVLGAIKLYNPLPWDIDADVSYKDSDYKMLKTHLSKLEYPINWKSPKNNCNFYGRCITSAYATINIKPSMFVELWPWDFASGYLTPNKKQTKIKFGDYYVYAMNNPGLYARNRYGSNILRHSVSWRILDKKDSWQLYEEAGTFPMCTNTENHACLDNFFADGNIQFKIPEI